MNKESEKTKDKIQPNWYNINGIWYHCLTTKEGDRYINGKLQSTKEDDPHLVSDGLVEKSLAIALGMAMFSEVQDSGLSKFIDVEQLKRTVTYKKLVSR